MAIESANIVGYQTIEIPGNSVYCMFTPTFDQVDSSKNNTLEDIIVVDKDGVEYDSSHPVKASTFNGKVSVRKLLGTGSLMLADSSTLATYTKSNKWGTKKTIPLVSGEGIIVQNKFTGSVYFRVQGQVVVEPIVAVPGNSVYSIVGNNTPISRTLADLKIYDATGAEYDSSHSVKASSFNGKISVRKFLTTGSLMLADSSTLATYTKSTKWGSAKGAMTIAPGESIVVQNKFTETVYLKFKGPLE